MIPFWLAPLAWTFWVALTALAIIAYIGTRPEPRKAEADIVRIARIYGAVALVGFLVVGLAKALRWMW
jgi:hypothetical protein